MELANTRNRAVVIAALVALVAALVPVLPSVPAQAKPPVTIMEIQGAGHLSPFEGVKVTTTGVVTAIAFNGYYVQDPVGDGDPR